MRVPDPRASLGGGERGGGADTEGSVGARRRGHPLGARSGREAGSRSPEGGRGDSQDGGESPRLPARPYQAAGRWERRALSDQPRCTARCPSESEARVPWALRPASSAEALSRDPSLRAHRVSPEQPVCSGNLSRGRGWLRSLLQLVPPPVTPSSDHALVPSLLRLPGQLCPLPFSVATVTLTGRRAPGTPPRPALPHGGFPEAAPPFLLLGSNPSPHPPAARIRGALGLGDGRDTHSTESLLRDGRWADLWDPLLPGSPPSSPLKGPSGPSRRA